MQFFLYIWFDKNRKMFYVGMHEGEPTDGYISSSRWFNGEHQYRPNDFRRKILKFFNTKEEARKEEARFLRFIEEHEFGKKYYNLKNGKPKGSSPWNKGTPMSIEQRKKLSEIKKGKPSPHKGKKFPKIQGLNNGMSKPESKHKLSKRVTGRKMATRTDGTRFWVYPSAD
jgi:NUMOD3 motif